MRVDVTKTTSRLNGSISHTLPRQYLNSPRLPTPYPRLYMTLYYYHHAFPRHYHATMTFNATPRLPTPP
ncbi:hypothetical protein Pcinc_037571 [Petrolisthes cinctipes]|uniref:Uncharacterized protein n=1 Tax=Petrolisthes cinctipes TaxID=88211 RepID=A0AAE1BS48_PETCI|nr:hypothetical protein Pcinc_037571 [Petrolisthes cinctipes]